MGEPGFMSLGAAAHIKAASKGGARHDKAQTPEERRSFINGIWLCQTHAHQVDHDELFTVEMLEEWKGDAEQRAFDQLIGTGGAARVYGPPDELIEELRDVVAALRLPQSDDLDSIVDKVRAAASLHLDAFHRMPGWPRHAIPLAMCVESTPGSALRFDATKLGDLLQATQEIALVAPPGTGKTTTLLQAGKSLLEGLAVPVFVPLKEWAESSDDLFAWTVNRNAFVGALTQHLKFLAYHGRLTLLLDGWNEVPSLTRRRLIVELDGLRRDFPLLTVVMSTRRQSVDVPLAEPRRITILQLSEAQQEELALGLAGDAGLTVLDHANRTPGLRDLVTIPLYLTALLKVSLGGNLPETREEILRRFVAEHESDAARADVLQNELLGNQHRYLIGLAMEAHAQANTALNSTTAQKAIGKVNKDLADGYVIQLPPNPVRVIDTLVSTHALERDADGNISFQHQQFQEWYASHHFEQELQSVSVPLSLAHPLTVERLNDPNWAEAILFACERLSRGGNGGELPVAAVVEVLLQIDPHFAATVMRRSSPSVWDIVGAGVQAFARQWHKPGQVDRALGFMITTGRPEFGDVVWPLITSSDQQTQLKSLRTTHRFDPAVLGDRLTSDYAALSENTRSTLLGELVDNGGSAGIDVAMHWALQDPSIAVRQHVFESLNFRAAGRHAEKLLRDSSDELVESVAAKGYFDEVTAPDLLMKLFEAERKQQTGASADMKLARLLRSTTSAGRSQQIATLLADPTFNFASDASKNSLFDVAREFPNVLNAALVSQIEAGKELPRHAKDYLSETLTRDVGPVREYVATPSTSAAKGAALIAGRELTHDLCLRYLASFAAAASGGDRSQGAWQPTRDLEAVLALTPMSSFFAAIARFGPQTPPEDISRLCLLVARHGRDSERGSRTLSAKLQANVVRALQNWAEALLSSSNNRRHLADVAGAMQRVPDPTDIDVVDRMLRRDQDVHAQARQAYKANPRDDRALQEMRISYSWTYRNALVAIGTDSATRVLTDHLSDEYFGSEAAIGLALIWRMRHGREGQIRPGIWPDADAIVANRESRRIDPNVTTSEAEAIFACVETLLSGGEPEHVRRAASMASAATLLPHGDKTGILGRLLAARLPASNTYGLLSHMAVGGIIVKAVDVMAGLESALAEIKDLAWLSEQNAEALLWWLGLFPCSDDPMALFTAIDRMPTTVSIHGWRMRHVLHLVAATAEREAPHILRELVVRFPELTDEYELQLALLRQPLDVLLDIMLDIASGKIGSRRGLEGVAYRFPGQVYERLTSPDIGRVVRRFQEAVQGPGKVFLGQILLAANDPEVFLMLAEDASGRAAAGGHLWMTLRDLLHDKVRINSSQVHHELIPRDSCRLREGLFLIALSKDQELSSFGTQCLTIVDEIRDEEGTSGIERRHPSIATGRPWPDVARAT
jgi:hypothetical protein